MDVGNRCAPKTEKEVAQVTTKVLPRELVRQGDKKAGKYKPSFEI